MVDLVREHVREVGDEQRLVEEVESVGAPLLAPLWGPPRGAAVVVHAEWVLGAEARVDGVVRLEPAGGGQEALQRPRNWAKAALGRVRGRIAEG